MTVWRIWDPVEEVYCRSGRGLYAKNGRSIWMTKSGASNTRNRLLVEIRDRVEIREYVLVSAVEKMALESEVADLRKAISVYETLQDPVRVSYFGIK